MTFYTLFYCDMTCLVYINVVYISTFYTQQKGDVNFLTGSYWFVLQHQSSPNLLPGKPRLLFWTNLFHLTQQSTRGGRTDSVR